MSMGIMNTGTRKGTWLPEDLQKVAEEHQKEEESFAWRLFDCSHHRAHGGFVQPENVRLVAVGRFLKEQVGIVSLECGGFCNGWPLFRAESGSSFYFKLLRAKKGQFSIGKNKLMRQLCRQGADVLGCQSSFEHAAPDVSRQVYYRLSDVEALKDFDTISSCRDLMDQTGEDGVVMFTRRKPSKGRNRFEPVAGHVHHIDGEGLFIKAENRNVWDSRCENDEKYAAGRKRVFLMRGDGREFFANEVNTYFRSTMVESIKAGAKPYFLPTGWKVAHRDLLVTDSVDVLHNPYIGALYRMIRGKAGKRLSREWGL
jgi:hypothetical protein